MRREDHLNRLLLALVFVCGGLGSICAAALDVAATIHVRIALPAVLPGGASVELTASDSPLHWTAVVRDRDGAATFPRVPPGRYRLAVRLAGFREAVAEVDVPIATTLSFVCELRSTDQTTGASELRLVRVESAGGTRAFDQSALETFPGDDALASVVETAVAPLIVDRMSTGGLWLGEAALIGGNGSSWRQTSILVGDIDVTDPVRTGTPLARIPPDAIASLLVSTTMLPASMGGPGAVLTMVPKSPAAARHAAVELAFIPRALQSATGLPGAPPIARFARHRDGNAQLGAPLGSRAGLFLAGRHSTTDRLERDDPTPLRTRVDSLFANTTLSTGEQGRLRLAGGADRAATPYAGRARFRSRDVRETDTFATAQAAWDRWTPGGTVWSASAGLAQGVLSPALEPVGTSDRVAAAGTVERLLDGPVPALFESFPGTRRRWTARADVAPAFARLGRHHLPRAGATLTRHTSVTSAVTSPLVGELVSGIPARIWDYEHGAPQARWTSTELAVYASDGLMLGDRVRVDAGLRVEAAHGSARGALSSVSWLSPTPRVSGRWLLDGRGRFSVFGGYARYMHRFPLDYLAYGDPAALSGRVYRWNDLNSDRVVQEGERAGLIAAVGPCCTAAGPSRIDPNLERPYTDEHVAGLEGRLGAWSARVMYTSRRERHLVGSVNTGVTRADYLLRYILDPGEPFRDPPEERLLAVYDRQPSSFGRDQYMLTNPAPHSSTYDALDVTIEGAMGTWLRTRFDGSADLAFAAGGNRGFGPLESDQGVLGELFEDPNAYTHARGHLFFDRAYVMKWWGSVRAPKQLVASVVARYQDGQPFSRLAVVPDLNQGAEAINGYRPGRTRFTFTLTVDAHVEKTMTVGRARVAGLLELFNLLNTKNEVEENVVTGPLFRRPTAVQPPRAARIGLRLAF